MSQWSHPGNSRRRVEVIAHNAGWGGVSLDKVRFVLASFGICKASSDLRPQTLVFGGLRCGLVAQNEIRHCLSCRRQDEQSQVMEVSDCLKHKSQHQHYIDRAP